MNFFIDRVILKMRFFLLLRDKWLIWTPKDMNLIN